MKNRTGTKRILFLLPAVILLLAAGTAVYVSDFYRAEPAAAALAEQPLPGAVITREADRIIFRPDGVKAGLIFYPGGKVEFTAYTPLMAELARQGLLCVLLKMPLNLAILNKNAAENVFRDFPEVSHWILAGHSLGGVTAAMYAADHPEKIDGLVLLAAYSTKNLKESGIKVLTIRGSEDGVLDREKYEAARAALPADTVEIVIPGGCHAGFGSYGPQKGDGLPSISGEEQVRITAGILSDWVRGGEEGEVRSDAPRGGPVPAP